MPDGITYNIRDTEAQEAIASLNNTTHFLGVTSTDIGDGSPVSNVTLKDGTTIAAADIKDGDIIIS